MREITTKVPNGSLWADRWHADARNYRKCSYYVRSPRGVLERLKAAAIEFALITILFAGFTVTVLFAVDLTR
jgi:hypothetical protein